MTTRRFRESFADALLSLRIAKDQAEKYAQDYIDCQEAVSKLMEQADVDLVVYGDAMFGRTSPTTVELTIFEYADTVGNRVDMELAADNDEPSEEGGP